MNSQNPQLMLTLGSLGFVTDGSTNPGPGLRRNFRGESMANQMRPPAMCGMDALTVFPGAPSGIAQSLARLAPVDGGEVG